MLRWIEGGSDIGAPRDPSLVGFPLHIGDLTLWSNVWLRVAVALQAPLHCEWLDNPDDLRLIDAAMARCATDAGIEMRSEEHTSELQSH